MNKDDISTSERNGHLSPPLSNLGRYRKMQFLLQSGTQKRK